MTVQLHHTSFLKASAKCNVKYNVKNRNDCLYFSRLWNLLRSQMTCVLPAQSSDSYTRSQCVTLGVGAVGVMPNVEWCYSCPLCRVSGLTVGQLSMCTVTKHRGSLWSPSATGPTFSQNKALVPSLNSQMFCRNHDATYMILIFPKVRAHSFTLSSCISSSLAAHVYPLQGKRAQVSCLVFSSHLWIECMM